jgi:ABC-2 type transport system ATP-binding protein
VTGTAAVLRAERLTKRYGPTVALDGLDLAVRPGEVYGFLGPNGAGKTTAIRLFLGLHRPTGGRALLFGRDAWNAPVDLHRRLAYVAGEPLLWPGLTGRECLAFLARLHGSVDEAYRAELVDRFEFEPDRRVREYSKGNRQKIQLIAAFAARPELLVLDEPTSGLDPLKEAAFRVTVAEARDRGQTVFLSSHILSEVEALCDRVGILRRGRLVEEGTLAELRHLSRHIVDVTFAGPPPRVAPPAGTIGEATGAASMRFAVRGPIGPLVDALAGTGIVGLESREPTLEELFLARYEGDANGSHG